MEIYVVKAGDTVYGIASSYSVDVNLIIFDNQLIYPYELVPGQALFIGVGERIGGRTISVSGYAYPFISRWVLGETLPYLSELPIFSYGFTSTGELIPPLWDDRWLIEKAIEMSVQPILTLTPFGGDGRFNNQLISSVVNNQEYIDNIIESILQTMRAKNYVGIDIDFEFILASDRDKFTDFVRQVSEAMRANGYHTSVALAPKNSPNQKGLLYEGKDYKALGQVADHLLLMTYEWGYTYGPPMAVAPINQVRRVVDYAVTEIPREKLDLGIPNYGYDWTLPYERGVSRAKTLGNVEAVRLAISMGSEIIFDQVAMSPYFRYVDSNTGLQHEVWFEDVRSLQAKFDLLEEYKLRGCGYWQIMQWFRANWLLLDEKFTVQKS
ncbi:MAG: LysM peptidoglycan-binding domain-containing protein [Lachnospiraceae bacterium]|nr:LysM peptidoglycan-binding domain-containing protein [Lachnospiraceae bacterium]